MAQATHTTIAVQNLLAPKWNCVTTSQQVKFRDARKQYEAKIEAANAGLAEDERQEPIRIIHNADMEILESQMHMETFYDSDGDELIIEEIDQLSDSILMRWLTTQLAETDSVTLKQAIQLLEQEVRMNSDTPSLKQRVNSIVIAIKRTESRHGLSAVLDTKAGKKARVECLIDAIPYNNLHEQIKAVVEQDASDPPMKRDFWKTVKKIRELCESAQKYDALKWQQTQGKHNYTLGETRAWRKRREVDQLSRQKNPQKSNSMKYKWKKGDPQKRSRESESRGDSAQNKNSTDARPRKKPVSCFKCGKDHSIYQCPECDKDEATKIFKEKMQKISELRKRATEKPRESAN